MPSHSLEEDPWGSWLSVFAWRGESMSRKKPDLMGNAVPDDLWRAEGMNLG